MTTPVQLTTSELHDLGPMHMTWIYAFKTSTTRDDVNLHDRRQQTSTITFDAVNDNFYDNFFHFLFRAISFLFLFLSHSCFTTHVPSCLSISLYFSDWFPVLIGTFLQSGQGKRKRCLVFLLQANGVLLQAVLSFFSDLVWYDMIWSDLLWVFFVLFMMSMPFMCCFISFRFSFPISYFPFFDFERLY